VIWTRPTIEAQLSFYIRVVEKLLAAFKKNLDLRNELS
jgi:hypothetical protein